MPCEPQALIASATNALTATVLAICAGRAMRAQIIWGTAAVTRAVNRTRRCRSPTPDGESVTPGVGERRSLCFRPRSIFSAATNADAGFSSWLGRGPPRTAGPQLRTPAVVCAGVPLHVEPVLAEVGASPVCRIEAREGTAKQRPP